jgi:hypothetical protein
VNISSKDVFFTNLLDDEDYVLIDDVEVKNVPSTEVKTVDKVQKDNPAPAKGTADDPIELD